MASGLVWSLLGCRPRVSSSWEPDRPGTRFLWEVFRREIVRIRRKASMRFLWEVFRRELVRILRKASMRFLWEVFMRFLWEVFMREIVRILRKGSMREIVRNEQGHASCRRDPAVVEVSLDVPSESGVGPEPAFQQDPSCPDTILAVHPELGTRQAWDPGTIPAVHPELGTRQGDPPSLVPTKELV
jgi:hypothetical protein